MRPLSEVVMSGFEKSTAVVECQALLTLQLVGESLIFARKANSPYAPDTVSKRISYRIQPMVDQPNDLISWSTAEMGEFALLGTAVTQVWAARTGFRRAPHRIRQSVTTLEGRITAPMKVSLSITPLPTGIDKLLLV